MHSSVFSRRTFLVTATSLASLCGVVPVFADEPVEPSVLRQEQDGFLITLRLPQEGIVAGTESVLYLRIEHRETDGTKQTVPFARVEATSTLADATKSEPLQSYPGGVAGKYSLVSKFATAGKYAIDVQVTPADRNTTAPIRVLFKDISVVSAIDKETERRAAYALKIDTSPAQPLSGERVTLEVSVIDTRNKKRITDFEPIYNAPLHLYIVREDTSDFRHVRPIALSDRPNSKDEGIFTVDYTFPTGGAWRILAEVAPQDEGTQVLTSRLTIPGTKVLPESMMPQITPLVSQNGITLRFVRPTRFIAGETTLLPLLLSDSQGNALSDLQIVDGSLAHLYFVDRDGKTLVHSVLDTSDPRNGRSGSNQFTFPVRFPRSGTYRAWLSVTRASQPALVSFVIKVTNK